LDDTIFLTGTVSPKGTYVIASYNANPSILALANKIVNDSTLLNTLQILLVNPQGKAIDKIGSTQLLQWINLQYGNFNNKTFKRQFQISKGDTNWVQGQTEWDISSINFNDLHHHKSVCNTANDFTLSIDDVALDCNNNYVDVAISGQEDGDDNTTFNYTEMEITYDPAIFGTNIVQNNRVTLVNAGYPIDASYPHTLADVNSSTIKITFGDNSGTASTATFTSGTPYPLFDLQILISNYDCNGIDPAITFDNVSSYEYNISNYMYPVTTMNVTSSQQTYTCDDWLGIPDSTCCCITVYDTTYTTSYEQAPYNSVTFVDNTFGTLTCPPVIDGVTYAVDTLDAGTNQPTDLLTINGKFFGSTQGGGTIEVTDANQSVVHPLLDNYDVISWSSNQVQVKLPTAIFPPQDIYTPGTGPIRIFTDCSQTTNYQNIDVFYSILNRFNVSNTNKMRPNIVMIDNYNSYVFRCDTSITHNPQALACIAKAIRVWNCYTGVNWRLGDEINLASNADDGISNIYFSNSWGTNISTLMITYTERLGCYDTINSVAFTNEADIKIRQDLSTLPTSPTWSYDTTGAILASNQRSFYDAILHELGHAQRLQHVNNTSDIMYRNPVTGFRPSLTTTSSALAGAFNVVSTSAGTSPSTYGCSYSTLVPSARNCIFASFGINTYENGNNLNVYPNPANDGEITIAYQLSKTATVQFKIVDYIGREIISLKQETKEQGKYTQQINISQLASGIYLLTANINGQYQSIKLIKL